MNCPACGGQLVGHLCPTCTLSEVRGQQTRAAAMLAHRAVSTMLGGSDDPVARQMAIDIGQRAILSVDPELIRRTAAHMGQLGHYDISRVLRTAVEQLEVLLPQVYPNGCSSWEPHCQGHPAGGAVCL